MKHLLITLLLPLIIGQDSQINEYILLGEWEYTHMENEAGERLSAYDENLHLSLRNDRTFELQSPKEQIKGMFLVKKRKLHLTPSDEKKDREVFTIQSLTKEKLILKIKLEKEMGYMHFERAVDKT